MTGRVIVITGANTGLGYRAAEILSEAGNDVILACRNEEKGKAAVEKILKKFPNSLATFMQLDLADLESVKKFVEDFKATGKKLHVLVNNAGCYLYGKDQRQFTKDNFEMMMGTNHLGPFLLTNLLLDELKKTASEEGADVRIVNVTSTFHDPKIKKGREKVDLDIEDFFLAKEGSFFSHQGYKNSKAAQVMCTYEMARRLKDDNITVNCVCPGYIPKTELGRHAGKLARAGSFMMGALRPVLKFVKTVDQGAQFIVDMAIKEELKGVTGKYYKDGAEATSSEESQKEDLQKQVYELSARYCHMEGYEPLDAPVPPPPESPKPKTPKGKKSKKEKAKEEETPGPSGDGDAANKEQSGEEIKYADDEAEKANKEKEEDGAKETEDKKEEKTEEEEGKQEKEEEKPEEDKKPAEPEDEDLKKDVKIEDAEITPAPEVAAQ